MTTILVDDTDPAIVYSSGWTQIETVSPWSNEFNATVHRADQNGLTASFTYSGGRITVIGTLESPGVYGYPSVTYTLDNGTPNTMDLTQFDQSVNVTDVTPRMVLYQSAVVDAGTHTLQWTVNNVSPSGAKFNLDSFLIENATLSPSKPYYEMIDDRNGDVHYSGSGEQGGFLGEYLGTDSTAAGSGPSFTYTFTGTGITAFATIYADQNPPAQVEIQLESQTTTYTIPPTSRRITSAVLYQIAGLTQGPHTITITTKSSSYWSFDHFLVQPNGGSNPNFFYAATTGNVSSSPGSSIGTIIPDPSFTATPQSLFVSYTLTNGIVVPETTYTSLVGDVTSTTSPPAAEAGQGSKKGASAGAIVGGVLAGIVGIILALFLFWWLRRRSQLKRVDILEDPAREKEVVQYVDSTDSIVARPFPASPSIPIAVQDGRRRKFLQLVHGYGEASGTAQVSVDPPPSGLSPDLSEKARMRQQRDPGPNFGRTTMASPSTVITTTSFPSDFSGSSGPRDTPATDTQIQPIIPAPRESPRPVERRRHVMRELDGGVRIASGDDDDNDDETVEILPPAYEQHGRRTSDAP